VLQSVGTGGSPIWVDVDDIIGGPYLPLTGGTLTGNLALTDATNNPSLVISTGSLTVGGVTTLNSTLDGTSATFTSDTGVIVYTTTSQVGAKITFSDEASSRSQKGFITYRHVDTQSYGSANSFIIDGDQATMTILADGKLMYKEGVYLKPATGTGAGTRKDNLWDAAYNDKITGLAVAGTTTKTLTATQQDGGTLTASWTDNDSGGTVTGTGANTQVAFWTGTSVIDGSSSLKWDNTNFRLGIGITPTYALDIYNSTGTTSSNDGTTLQRLWNYVGGDLQQQKTFIDFVFQDGNDNEYPQVRIGAEVGQNGNADTQLKEGSGAFVVYTNNATTSVPGTNSLTERMRVDYAGNVGIGATTPARLLTIEDGVGGGDPTDSRTKLYINGSAEAYMSFNVPANQYMGIRYAIAGTNKAFMEFEDPNNYLRIGTVSADSIVFATTNSTKMVILPGGNVGVGVSGPITKLEVEPSTGNSSIKTGTLEMQSYSVNNAWLADNIYYNGAFRLRSAGYGSQIYFGSGGDITFKRYPTGSAGDAVTGINSMQLTSGGQVGIGITPKAWTIFTPIQIGQASGFIGRTSSNQTDVSTNWYYNGAQLRINTGFAQRYTQHSNGDHTWMSAPTGAADSTITWTEYMRIDQSTGNVGIGETSPSEKLEVAGRIKIISTGGAHLILNGDTNNSGDTGEQDAIIDFLGDGDPGLYGFRINSENYGGATAMNFQEYLNGSYSSRLYINKDGYTKIKNDGDATWDGYNFHAITQSAASEPTVMIYNDNTGGNNYGINVVNRSTSSNTTGRFFLGATNNGATEKIKIYTNGNIQNTNNSYTQLSDLSLKENVVDATDKLEEVKKLRVINWNFIGDDLKQIGVAAQEVEKIFPGLVDEVEHNQDGETSIVKSVKYSVFVPILIKAIQELETRVKELENK
jgi:hypothetical protein